jgi:NADH:ubiquinone oxidoreductase subunit
MARINLFGVLSTLGILLKTLVGGRFVGVDNLGNKYYRGKPRGGTATERRWVIYKNAAEATLVPPEWHGWLHYQTDIVPAGSNPARKAWQKPHQPNATGTTQAYLPDGHILKGGQRSASASGDYTAWQPPQ